MSDLLLCDACNICCLIQSHIWCTEVQLKGYSCRIRVIFVFSQTVKSHWNPRHHFEAPLIVICFSWLVCEEFSVLLSGLVLGLVLGSGLVLVRVSVS